MKNPISLVRALGATVLLCAGSLAQAAPVTLNLTGSVTGYEYIDLGAYMPVGSNVSLSLSFNETFSDGTYSFADDLGPVSGSMTVGGAGFVLDGGTPWSYSFDLNSGNVTSVTPQFTGTGPAFGGGAFFALFAQFATDLTLVGDLLLGYGFTTTYEDGLSITNYGYAKLTPGSYSITPNAVPEPSTLALFALASLAAVVRARRRPGDAR